MRLCWCSVTAPPEKKLELEWIVAAGPGVDDLRTQIARDGVGAGEGSDDATGDEVWFSADELARSSEVELGRHTSAPGALSRALDVTRALAEVQARPRVFDGPFGRVSEAVASALVGVGPGRLLEVRAPNASLAADAVTELADALCFEGGCACLLASPRPRHELTIDFLARYHGVAKARYLSSGPSAGESTIDAATTDAREARWRSVELRSALSSLEGDPEVEVLLAIGEAVRVFRRRQSTPVPLVLAVPRPEEFDVDAAPTDRFTTQRAAWRRLSAEYGVVVLWAVPVRSADEAGVVDPPDARDARLELAFATSGPSPEALEVCATDPLWGTRALSKGRWEPATGRVWI